MSLLRTLAHLMLVLALLAGGLAPGAASAEGAAGGDMAENCHDLAGDTVGPPEAAPADCCDGGCACDCMHPAHVGLLAAPRLAAVTVREAGQRPFDGAMPTTRAAPEVRPPIA